MADLISDLIPEWGLLCLIMSLGFSCLLSFMPLIKRLSPSTPIETMGSSFALGQMVFVMFSFMALAWAFYTDDFSVAYVAHNSNANLPTPYKLSAIWGGHEGSMLLWYMILCFWTCLFSIIKPKNIINNTDNDKEITKLKFYSLMVLGVLGVGFNLFLLTTSNPFARYLPEVPLEGADLNPLLQDFGLIIHPPILYLGYVGFAIPFALAVGSLLVNHKSTSKNISNISINIMSTTVSIMKPWVLTAWVFLTLGITLGSWWAYYELGWGGWWFWDPVENASVMPWLSGIALIHMLKATQKSEIFPKWTLLLAICCFSLSLLGTFLVRSGVLISVHSFATDPLRGQFILNFLTLIVGGALLIWTLKSPISPPKTISSSGIYSRIFSRESLMFLGSIFIFVFMLSVLLGTLYPLIIETFYKTALSVGPPYFNIILIPFITIIVLLMGIAPYVKWREDNIKNHIKLISCWALISGSLSIILPLCFKLNLTAKLILGLFLSFWALISLIALSVKRFKNNNFFNQSFISMAMAHLGVAITILGVTLSTHLEIEKDVAMKLGDTANVGDYKFYLKALTEIQGPNYQGIKANIEISDLSKSLSKSLSKGEKNVLKSLYPEKRFYIPREMPVSETAIDPGFLKDFYVALGEPISQDTWSVRIYIKPFVRWIWLGGILMALGAGMAVFKFKRR